VGVPNQLLTRVILQAHPQKFDIPSEVVRIRSVPFEKAADAVVSGATLLLRRV